MRRRRSVIALFIAAVLYAAAMPVSAAGLQMAAAPTASREKASIFVGEGLFCDFEKKLKITDSTDYFFTDGKMSYASFEEKYLPLILEILAENYDASYSVFFSFGEEDTENPFAYSLGVGAEIAALLNELRTLYPEVAFYFAEFVPEKEENREEVSELNASVRRYCLCPVAENTLLEDTGLTTLAEIRASGKAILTAFEKLNDLAGQGDSGLLFSDGTGYLYENGTFLPDFTGLKTCGDQAYYFVSGIFTPDFEGTAQLDGETWYVKNGLVDRSKNGDLSLGGFRYTFENGKAVSVETEGKSYTPEELHAMKAVFLTFDDGPSPVTTDILNTMDKYGVKATFFVTKQPVFLDILKEEVSRGHAIGIHTASHDYDTIYSSFDAWKADFDEIYAWVLENTGVTPTSYRFPGGSNTKRPTAEDKQKMKDYVHSLGMEYYDWNVITGDGDWRVTAEEELVNATAEIDYRTIPVILAHDQDHNKSTAEALDSILAELTGRGYHFMTLQPGIPPVQQGSNWDY